MFAIETHALTKRFRRVATYRDLIRYPWRRQEHLAIDDLSLQVREGELFGLLGENGAGKTTVIRMLATMLLPTSGVARVGGYDVVRQPERIRRLIGLVTGEERSFYWRLTGRENLAFFAALNHLPTSVARRKIDQLLEVIGIGDVADETFHSYSTGTRHKFSIARGLLTDPQVLFLDEPTRSLDPIAAGEVQRLLNDRIIRNMGRTALMATHSLAEAEAICDRVAIIHAGSLVAAGSIGELRRDHGLSTVCTIRVTSVPNEISAQLGRMPGVVVASTRTEGAGIELGLVLDRQDGVLDGVLRHLVAAGAAIASCETREPTLEEIYRRVLDADAPHRPGRVQGAAPA